MKKIIFILSLFVCVVAHSQIQNLPGSSPLNRVRVQGGLKVDSLFGMPSVLYALTNLDSGYLAFNRADSSLYLWTKYQWLKVSGSGGTISGSGTTNKLAIFTSGTVLGNSSVFTDSAGKIRADSTVDYLKDFSASYNTRTLVDKNYVDVAIAGVVVGSGSDLVNTTIAALDASTGFNTSKTYFITDQYKQGLYRYTGVAADQSTDNQGLRIITADLKVYDRWLFDGKVNPVWFFPGTYTPATVANNIVDTAVGSDIAPSVNAAMRAFVPGLTINMPDVYVTHSLIDTLKNKSFIFQIDGTIHSNKRPLFRIYPPDVAGPDKAQIVRGNGTLIGWENQPAHTKTTHDNGTGPNWAAMTWNAFEIGNCNKNTIEMHKVGLFGSFIQFRNGGGNGTQENSVAWQWVDRCARGISMVSTDGSSFCDKNVFTGPNGGQARLDCGLGLELDGNAGAGFTGSANYNTLQGVTFERVDSVARINGRWTEGGLEHCKIEQGLPTGVFGNQTTAIVIRNGTSVYDLSSARGFYMNGCDFLYIDMLTSGIGIAGSITNTPLWVRDLPAGNNAAFVGTTAISDETTGLIVIQDAPQTLSLTNRNRAPAVFKFRESARYRDEDTTITSTTYTLALKDRWVKANNTAGVTITIPAAATALKKNFTVSNIAASGTVTLSGLTYGTTTIAAGTSANIHGDGSLWTRTDGGIGGGSSQWITSGTNIYYPSGSVGNVGIGITTPTARLHLAAGTAAAGSSSLKIPAGTLMTTQENWAIENDGVSFYVTNGNTRRKLLDELNPANVSNKTFTDFGNIYTIDGALSGPRILTQGANALKFTGTGDFQKYGGLLRVAAASVPINGTLGTLISGSSIFGQTYSGTVWNNSGLNLGSTGNLTTMYGTVTLPDIPLGTSSGGTGLNAIGTAGQGIRVNAAASGLEYYSTNSLWRSGTPTFTSGSTTVIGSGFSTTLTGTPTNASGKIVVITGTSISTAGTLITVNFDVSSESMTGSIPIIFAATAAAATQPFFMTTTTNSFSIVCTSNLSPSTTYTWYYQAEKK